MRQSVKAKTFRKPTYTTSARRAAAYSISRARRWRRRDVRAQKYLGIEQKFLDCYASALVIPAPTDAAGGEMQPEGGCTNCISAPAQGDGEQNRDGRKITIKSCFVSFNVFPTVVPDQADVAPGAQVYVALVLDTQANGATIVSENVYTNPNDTAQVNTYPIRNLRYSSRYKILDHKLVNMNPVTAGTDGAGTLSLVATPRSDVLSWKGEIPVTFTDTTANVTSVTDNAFHIIAFATAVNYTPALSYNSRIRFVG